MAEPRQTDPWVLVEAGMILLLIVLTIFLYWVPAAREPFIPQWYSAFVLGGLFFAILGLHSWRVRRGAKRALRRTLAEVQKRGVVQEDEPE